MTRKILLLWLTIAVIAAAGHAYISTALLEGASVWQIQLQSSPNLVTVSGAGFEITYENVVYESTWPIERWIKRNVVVRNTSSENLTLDFNVTCVETGQGVSPFPQPSSLYLQPGESENIWYFLDVSYRTGLGNQDMEIAADHTFTADVDVWPRGNQSAVRTARLNHLVHVAPVANLTTNSTVQGHVYDNETGQPMAGVEIALGGANSVPGYKTISAGDGSYSLAAYAYKYLMSQEPHEYNLSVQLPGYKAFHKVLEPAEGGTLQVDIFLEKQTASASHVLVDNYQTNLTIWRGDVTPDEKYFVVSHGHVEGFTEEEVHERASIFYFTIDGTLRWQRFIGNEVWGIDISDDGSYVAACVMRDEKIILFDKDNNELWSTDALGYGRIESREVRISHNNQHVAFGSTGGTLYLVNRADGSKVWEKFLDGQIRRIEFSQDDQRIYVGSGDGFLYKLDINGNLIWRTNVEAWPYTYGLAITGDESLIATASKIGKIYLTDSSGKTLWYFDTRGGGEWCGISPDRSVVVAGSGGAFGTVVLGENGDLLWWGPGSASGMVTSDGKYILIGSETIMLLDMNGTNLWSYTKPSSTHFSYITQDKSKIIAGDGAGNIYFFVGEIASAPSMAVVLNEPTNTTTNSTSLSWSPSANENFQKYEIHMSATPNFTPSSATLLTAITDRSTTIYTVENLSSGTTYHFKVRTCSLNGTYVDSGQKSVTTLGAGEGPPAGGQPGEGINWLLVGGIVGVIVAAIVAVMAFRRR